MKLKLHKPEKLLLLSCLTLSSVLCLFSPVDMLLNNSEAVWFHVSTVIWPIIGIYLASVLLLVLFGFFLGPKAQKMYSFVLLGLSVAFYIQGNFLNQRINVLNGNVAESTTYAILINLLVWAGILGAFVCIPLFLKSSVRLGGMIALIMTLTLISTLCIESMNLFGDKNLSDENENQKSDDVRVTTDQLYTIGEDDNIIVILIDMLDQIYMDEYIQNNPSYFDDYEGFVYYKNYMGLFTSTRNSVRQLLSGTLFHNEVEDKEYQQGIYSDEELYLRRLNDAGYACDVYTSDSYMKYSDVTLFSNIEEKTKDSVSQEKASGELIYTWMKLSWYRYFPELARNCLTLNAYEYDVLKRNVQTNADNIYTETQEAQIEFYNRLKENEMTVEGEKRYKFIHLWGMHIPFGINEDVQRDESAIWSQSLEGCMKIVSAYLDELKRLDKYDSSTILLLADHGAYNYSPTNPFLLVKPQSAKSEFSISEAPVWQMDYVPSILKAAGLAYSEYGLAFDDIGEEENRERYYYLHFQEDQPLYGVQSKEQIEFVNHDRSGGAQHFTATGKVYGNDHAVRELSDFIPVEKNKRMDLANMEYRGIFDYGVCTSADSSAFSWGYSSQLSCTLQDYDGASDATMVFDMQGILENQKLIVKSGETVLYEGPIQQQLEVKIPADCIDNGRILLKIEYPRAQIARLTDPQNVFIISVLFNAITCIYESF